MTDLVRLAAANAARWRRMAIHPELVQTVDRIAARLLTAPAKAHYIDVSGRTGVPWWVIAVIHEREASQSWTANLAQGDLWDRRSVHDPAGRGPFTSWEAAAVDALTNCEPHAARWRDWSIGGTLTLLEQYNGLGYAGKGMPSPYVWASTNQYTHGKFVSDHNFDINAIDHQIGCAALLACMKNRDASIRLVDGPGKPVASAAAPKPTTIAGLLASAVAAVFKRIA